MIKYILFFIGLLANSHLFAYDFDSVAHVHILPGYENLTAQTKKLDISANNYCQNSNQTNLNQLRLASKEAFLSWQRVQHIRFGPVQGLSREYRYQFWPDKRGIVNKQLKQLLGDPALNTDHFDISQKSVAVQGFSALEQLIFSAKQIDNNRCTLILAITSNLHTMSERVLQGWKGGPNSFLKTFLNPGSDNLFFANESELASRLLNSLYTQLEFIITQKLSLPLGKNIDKSRPRFSEAWRSKTSMPALRTNLTACQELFQVSFASKITATNLNAKIISAFGEANGIVNTIEIPMSEAVQNPEIREQLIQLREELLKLKHLVTRDLASTLDLSLGFNSLDGD